MVYLFLQSSRTTLICAVAIVVALVATSAMRALRLKHNPPPQRGFFAWFNRQVDAVTRGFGHAAMRSPMPATRWWRTRS